jgi:O-acetyl-ADP-ribose deacetylase (regulator of RNase III)
MGATTANLSNRPILRLAVRPTTFVESPAREAVLEFTVGDLTHEVSDAIVNPFGAGRVDLAVRRAAGPELLEAFHRSASVLPRGKLSPGRAVLTPGFGLRAAHVIHCDPPVYADDPVAAAENLAACHTQALRLAREHGLTSISFPAIATGIHRYPASRAAEIAVSTVLQDLRAYGVPHTVRFVLLTPAMLDVYAAAARAHLHADPTRTQRGLVFTELSPSPASV